MIRGRWILLGYFIVCGLLPFAGEKWSGAAFFVLSVFGFVPLVFVYVQWQSGGLVRRLIAAGAALVLILGTGWQLHENADTPEHRKEWWSRNPEVGLQRLWVKREVNDQQKTMSSGFFDFKKDHIDVTYYHHVATLSGVKESSDDIQTVSFRVIGKGVGKDGHPYVNFTSAAPDLNWSAVLDPEKKTMDLFCMETLIGRFSPVVP